MVNLVRTTSLPTLKVSAYASPKIPNHINDSCSPLVAFRSATKEDMMTISFIKNDFENSQSQAHNTRQKRIMKRRLIARFSLN
jgi:hypothetical protein